MFIVSLEKLLIIWFEKGIATVPEIRIANLLRSRGLFDQGPVIAIDLPLVLWISRLLCAITLK